MGTTVNHKEIYDAMEVIRLKIMFEPEYTEVVEHIEVAMEIIDDELMEK